MPYLCQNYAIFVPEFCQICARFVPELCQICARIVSDLHQKCAPTIFFNRERTVEEYLGTGISVTRLGEFSPIGLLWSVFFDNFKSSLHFWATFFYS
jgi:hypothetical protein